MSIPYAHSLRQRWMASSSLFHRKSKSMRIGMYGGSFDPVHLGHLWVAESIREHLQLDQVRFVPTSVSPLKQGEATANDRQRREMLELAIGGHPQFVLDDRELNRGGVSYTVDTLRELAEEFQGAELYLILGADSMNDFERWKSPEEILKLAIPAVVARGGGAPIRWELLEQWTDANRIRSARDASLETPLIEISSRELRSRVHQGKSIRFRVPRGVECFIENANLYRGSSH